MENGLMQDAEAVSEEIELLGGDPRSRVVLVVVAIAIALLSFFVVGNIASSPDAHASTISALDEKKGTVMGLVAASTAASTAVSLLPGDAGSPIAQKLIDLSSDFLIVLTAIYLEKYLLTTLGFAAFKILIPFACLVFAASLFVRERLEFRRSLMRLSSKLAVFGIALFLAVPVSVGVSGMIESTYEDTINETIAAADQTVNSIEATAVTAESEGSAEEAASGESASTALDFVTGIPNALGNAVANLSEGVQGAVTGLIDKAQKALNGFIEALAVMIVTSCVIPIVVLVFFLWLAKIILGIDVSAPAQMIRPRFMRKAVK